VIFSLLALVLGGAVVLVDQNALRSGAAVVTAVLTAVFAVMVTVPARGLVAAVRETVVALLVSAVGSMATLGWAPEVDLRRFEYTVLGLALVASFLTVYRLGSGFHGLGTRVGEPVADVAEQRRDESGRGREHHDQPGREAETVQRSCGEGPPGRLVDLARCAAFCPSTCPPTGGSAGHGLGHRGEATGGGWPTTDWYDAPRPPPTGPARR
jgi:hypothetical protein